MALREIHAFDPLLLEEGSKPSTGNGAMDARGREANDSALDRMPENLCPDRQCQPVSTWLVPMIRRS